MTTTKFFVARSIALAVFLLTGAEILAQDEATGSYKVVIDIANIDKDRVAVKITPPPIDKALTVYNMPKIVPGTYSISDFGRFVEDFEAIDTLGKPMRIERLDTNRWAILNPQGLDHIRYKVNDTFDESGSGGIFEPAGTNFEAGENMVLNLFGLVGYFDNMKDHVFELSVIRPEGFFGATSLSRQSGSSELDGFLAKNYFDLHDAPILYAMPDTASMKVANARVTVAVYSPGKVMNSTEVLEALEDIFLAAATYLGGALPVENYNVLLYLSGNGSVSGSYGALEHNTSTVFVLPEAPLIALKQTIRDVVAHEFFHIVTPLNIHSEQIHNYDFIRPQMSQHLWLYEGCTEYAAHHVQVKHGLLSLSEYLEVMRGKILSASQYDTGIAFTELSKKALDEHASQYGNVYQQGALIGLAVDLKLRILSHGVYGIQDLMKDLAQAYGPDKPFKDADLFTEIANLSGFPEMEEFLKLHLDEAVPLPLDQLLAEVGITYAPEVTSMVISAGNISFGFNPRRERLVIIGTDRLDDFGTEMGFKRGDEVLSWNGAPVTMDNIKDVLNAFKTQTQPGKKVKVVVDRKQDDGTYKKMKLKAKAQLVEQTKRDILAPMDNPSEKQLELRRSWISI